MRHTSPAAVQPPQPHRWHYHRPQCEQKSTLASVRRKSLQPAAVFARKNVGKRSQGTLRLAAVFAREHVGKRSKETLQPAAFIAREYVGKRSQGNPASGCCFSRENVDKRLLGILLPVAVFAR
jgi:hypothetical protein